MKTAILKYLKYHTNSSRPIRSRELETMLCVSGSDVRQIIHDLRCSGEMICSDNRGYYYTSDPREFHHTYAHLKGRALSMLSLLSAFEKHYGNTNQVDMF